MHNLDVMNKLWFEFIASLDLLSLQLLKQYKMTNFKSSEIHCVHGPDTDVNAYAIRLCLQKIVSQEEKSNSVMQKKNK